MRKLDLDSHFSELTIQLSLVLRRACPPKYAVDTSISFPHKFMCQIVE